MNKGVRNAILISTGGALVIVLFLLWTRNKPVEDSQLVTPTTEETVVTPDYDGVVGGGSADISVTIADTEEKRELGLSYTQILAPHTGKLFIFENPGIYGFWMKDMNYALDMVWINKDLQVLGVAENVTPDSYPKVFFPPSAVQYVLEMNAYDAAAMGLTKGTSLILKKEL